MERWQRARVHQDIGFFLSRSILGLGQLLKLYGIAKSTYHGWFDQDGRLCTTAPERKSSPRSILPSEEEAVVAYRMAHRHVGYRKLAWMMIDENVAYLSESSVYQILQKHDLITPWVRADHGETQKEYSHKPRHPHHHWHMDIAYVKVGGVFYFLIMMLDGYSRYLLDWELMPDMLGRSVQEFTKRSKAKYPEARPKLITDNGSQFVSHDFKKLASRLELEQVFTRRNHPQTNGKIERLNGTVKNEAIRMNYPTSYQEAVQVLNDYVYEYNHQRLHAGVNYLRPADMFFGRGNQILEERKLKLKKMRSIRKAENKIAALNAS